MNQDFADIIKRIIAEQSNDKDAKNALTKAIKMRFAEELKNANEKERPFTKAYLAQKLHEEGRFDLTLCNKTLDTLCEALFNEQATETLPELAPQPQAAHRLAAEPTNKVPRPATDKRTYILTIIVLTLLFVIVVGVWYEVWTLYIKPEITTEQTNSGGDKK